MSDEPLGPPAPPEYDGKTPAFPIPMLRAQDRGGPKYEKPWGLVHVRASVALAVAERAWTQAEVIWARPHAERDYRAFRTHAAVVVYMASEAQAMFGLLLDAAYDGRFRTAYTRALYLAHVAEVTLIRGVLGSDAAAIGSQEYPQYAPPIPMTETGIEPTGDQPPRAV